MSIIFKRYFFFVLVVSMMSCDSDEEKKPDVCGDSIVVNEDLFSQESPNEFQLLNAEIIDDCIAITIGSNLCDGSTWQADLVTDGIETTAIPPSRLIRFNFTNLEDCEAFEMRTYQFYLGDEDQTVIYSLEDWEGELIYNE